MIKLAVATFLWAVSTPYGLNLIALEWELYLLAVLYNEACKRHGQVVAQTFLADLGGQCTDGAIGQLLRIQRTFPVAGIQDLKEQLVALLAILAHQRTEVLHSRSLNLLKAIK